MEIKLGQRILCDAFIRIKNIAPYPMSAFDQVVRHSGGIPPKADPENWSFAVVKASAFIWKAAIELNLPIRAANDPKRTWD